MKAKEFDRAFDEGKEIVDRLDLAKARRPALKPKRVKVDFPLRMVRKLDKEAKRLGVPRQSIITRKQRWSKTAEVLPNKYLPPTCIASLLTTVVMTSAGLAYLGVTGAYPLVVLAAGLWRLTVWARSLTVIILWFMVLILPMAALNPINDADIMKSGDPAILSSTLLKLVPMMLTSLWVLHVFGKYRGEFKRKIF